MNIAFFLLGTENKMSGTAPIKTTGHLLVRCVTQSVK